MAESKSTTTTSTTTTTAADPNAGDSHDRPAYLNPDGTYHIQTAAERKAEEDKRQAEQLRIITEHRKVFDNAYYNPYKKREVKMNENGPWAIIYDKNQNPDENQRNRAVKFIKALWTNVKRYNYKDEHDATRRKYRTLSGEALRYKLGHVRGCFEVLEALGFKKNEDGSLLVMDIDDNLETGYKLMWELDEWVSKYKYVHKWDAHEVIKEFLWIGDKEDARDKAELKVNRITHILNCTDNVDNYFEKDNDQNLQYKKLAIKDFNKEQCIEKKFPEAIEFVADAKRHQGRVLVHCYTGMNRSVTIATIILMQSEKKNLQEAFEIIKAVHRNAAPFAENREKLLEYEKKTRGQNSMSITDFPKHENYYKKIKAQQKAKLDADEAYLRPLRKAQERAKKEMGKYSNRYFTHAYEYLTLEQRNTMARNHQKINRENEEKRRRMERPKEDIGSMPSRGIEDEKIIP